MEENSKTKVLSFLYKWVNDGKIAHIRKGMVEELEQFLTQQLSQAQIDQITQSMQAKSMVEALPPIKGESDAQDPQQ